MRTAAALSLTVGSNRIAILIKLGTTAVFDAVNVEKIMQARHPFQRR